MRWRREHVELATERPRWRRTAAAVDAARVHGCGGGRVTAAEPQADRRSQERLEEARRKEGEALFDLADAAMGGRAVSDFAIQWRNDFLKAQTGTFVPFTLTIDRSRLTAASALMYVRAARRDAGALSRRDVAARYPFDIIFPVELTAPAVSRFASRAGSRCRPATTMCTSRCANAPRIRWAGAPSQGLPS